MEKAIAPHSSTLAWKIPWTEEPGRLPSMGSRRVGHDWATSLSLFTFMHWRRKWQPTPCSCLENPRDRGAWWAAIYGVAQSQTRLYPVMEIGAPLVTQMVKIHLQCRSPGFNHRVGKILWRREWLPIPVYFPEKLHGQRSLADYSPWGHKESDMTEKLTLSVSFNDGKKSTLK